MGEKNKNRTGKLEEEHIRTHINISTTTTTTKMKGETMKSNGSCRQTVRMEEGTRKNGNERSNRQNYGWITFRNAHTYTSLTNCALLKSLFFVPFLFVSSFLAFRSFYAQKKNHQMKFAGEVRIKIAEKNNNQQHIYSPHQKQKYLYSHRSGSWKSINNKLSIDIVGLWLSPVLGVVVVGGLFKCLNWLCFIDQNTMVVPEKLRER